MKRNITNNDLPSLEEIKLYQQGQLDPERAAAIKAQAVQSPLLAEALEGFAEVGAYDAVPNVSVFLANHTHAAASAAAASPLAAAATNTAAAWWSMNTVIAVVTTIAVLTAGSIFYFNNESSETNTTPSTTINSSSENKENNNLVNTTNESSWNKSDNNLPANNEIISNPLSNNSSNVSAALEPNIVANNNATTTTTIDPLNTKSINQLGHTNDSLEMVMVQQRAGIAAVSITRILNYKVADYTKMRSKEWQSFESELGGLPAPFASEEDRAKAEEENLFTTQIPYMNYLTQCVQAMNQNNYALAINKFKVIAQQYPDDVNAQFYTARCYYENGEFENAITYYDKTIKNSISTFREEAEFYKAKSLKALGRTEEAKALFTEIVNKQKFYALKAAKELN